MNFRNNNPGNIRNNPAFKWVGQIGVDYRGFVIFDTLEHGTRALMRLLNTYVNTGRDTIGEIIYSYCPPTECNTELYIQQVSGWMGTGWHRNSKISPADKTNFLRFVNCIVKKEFSQQLTAATLENGYNLAFNGITPAPPAQETGFNYAGLFVPALLLTGIVLISKRQ